MNEKAERKSHSFYPMTLTQIKEIISIKRKGNDPKYGASDAIREGVLNLWLKLTKDEDE
jgi:hypothetical protein